MCGIGPYEIRVLCESPWEGGGGYLPADVGEMTPDMIWLRLVDRKRLKGGGVRQTMTAADAAEMAGGRAIRGRLENGEIFYAEMTGGATSMAQRILEKEKQEQEQEQKQRERRERHRQIERKNRK